MTLKDLELLDFRVTDLNYHVHSGVGTELQLGTKSSVSASTPEPFDGTLYVYLNTLISDPSEELFRFEIKSQTIMKLPEGTAEVKEEDAPACITLAQNETYNAILGITTAMGIPPLDLNSAE